MTMAICFSGTHIGMSYAAIVHSKEQMLVEVIAQENRGNQIDKNGSFPAVDRFGHSCSAMNCVWAER